MSQLISFIKKEILELSRGGKFLILVILFVLIGIMNPAMAKLTPMLMEMMADQLAESGITVGEIQVTAYTSWEQFYKNIPTALIIFVIMMGNIFTTEYQRGTLVNMVTKGLNRWKILIAKFLVLAGMWSLCFWGCFGITYAYNAYFWDNGIMHHLGFSAVMYWFCGLWIVSVIPLASAVCSSSALVLLAAGAAYLVPTLLGMLPKLQPLLPTRLMDTMSLLNQASAPEDYYRAFFVAGALLLFNVVAGTLLFNRRSLS